MQKKQGFGKPSSEKKGPKAVQKGLGRRPILKKGAWTPKNFCLYLLFISCDTRPDELQELNLQQKAVPGKL